MKKLILPMVVLGTAAVIAAVSMSGESPKVPVEIPAGAQGKAPAEALTLSASAASKGEGTQVDAEIAPLASPIDIPQNFVRHSPSEFAGRTEAEIRHRLSALSRKIDSEKWVERANQHRLTMDQREELAEMLQEVSALRIALVDRNMDEAERLLEEL